MYLSEETDVVEDCRNILRSSSWSPAWVREKRTPKFVDGDSDSAPPGMPQGAPPIFGMGLILLA